MLPEEVIAALTVLECKASASPEEVESSYRELLKVWDPDRFECDSKLKAIPWKYPRIMTSVSQNHFLSLISSI